MKNQPQESIGHNIDTVDIFDENKTAANNETFDDVTGELKIPTKVPFFLGLVTVTLGAIAFALAFVPGVEIFGLCASIFFELASISLFGAQRARNNIAGTDFLLVISYVLCITFVAFFVGGIVWSFINLANT